MNRIHTSVFSSKANTLAYLRPLVECSQIGDQVEFTISEWNLSRGDVLDSIINQFPNRQIIIRSSAVGEDSVEQTQAGVYRTIKDVESSSTPAVIRAVDSVIDSYHDFDMEHQVLVQEMLVGVVANGVAFSRHIDSAAPYYQISYDLTAGKTDTVTSGTSSYETIVVRRGSVDSIADLNEIVAPVLPAVQEVEALTGHSALDIEFAVTADEIVHLLQARPLVSHGIRHPPLTDQQIHRVAERTRAEIVKNSAPTLGILGNNGVFGVMPDWNPAEMIGRRPRSLAVSLYKLLITDHVWAVQRSESGYRNLVQVPLVVTFAGQPYVDVRASINSFMPSSLTSEVATIIVEFALERLTKYPALHDKIEFELIPTAYVFDFDRWTNLLSDHTSLSGPDLDAWREGLTDITRFAISQVPISLDNVRAFSLKCESLQALESEPLVRATRLLDTCKGQGTLPFAHLARSAFVAVGLLRSAEAVGLIGEGLADRYLRSVRTVARQFGEDCASVNRGRLEWSDLVVKYGHLRPGTYDITHLSYAETEDQVLRPLVELGRTPPLEEDLDWTRLLSPLSKTLQEVGIHIDPDDLDRFFRTAIEGREYGKFEFTRYLSHALDALVEFGAINGVDRDDLSHCHINDLLPQSADGLSQAPSLESILYSSGEGQRIYRESTSIELPPLILNESNVDVFALMPGSPNFVGDLRTVAQIADLVLYPDITLDERIVCLESADPGFDWIFGTNLVGLVTMYGGANSHMTIRASEFQIPAAIGVGELLFDIIRKSRFVELDPINRRISPL